MEELYNIPKFTPDRYKLDQSEYHLMFDPGQEISWPLIGTAFSVPRMTLYDHPIDTLMVRIKGIPKARLQGRLFLVSTQELEKLDKIKQNGVLFDRKKICVVIAQGQTVEEVPQTAWTYVGRNDEWADELTFDRNARCGKIPLHKWPLAQQYPSDISYLHNRFSLLGGRFNDVSWNNGSPTSFVGTPTAMVVSACIRDNHYEIVRIRREARNARLERQHPKVFTLLKKFRMVA